jgi:7-cyano-7-deazaguanine reductase
MSGIERFEAPETDQITTFQTDELTALCPFEFGGPDHYTLTIRYEADQHCLESKSLKLWLESYRDREITAEGLAEELYRDIHGAIEPKRLYIRLEQARRGGITETVEVVDCALR